MDTNPKNPWPKIVKVRMDLIGECPACKTQTKMPDFKNYIEENDNFEER